MALDGTRWHHLEEVREEDYGLGPRGDRKIDARIKAVDDEVIEAAEARRRRQELALLRVEQLTLLTVVVSKAEGTT